MKTNILLNPPKTLEIRITNLTDSDRTFLRDLLGLFTDPRAAASLKMLQRGELALQYEPQTGHCYQTDLRADLLPAAPEQINFLRRFNEQEFDQLSAHSEFESTWHRDITEAEDLAKQILGYLPPATPCEIAKG